MAVHPDSISLKTASFIFALLFLLTVVTRAVRSRAHR
jgi:hypothetical protein